MADTLSEVPRRMAMSTRWRAATMGAWSVGDGVEKEEEEEEVKVEFEEEGVSSTPPPPTLCLLPPP